MKTTANKKHINILLAVLLVVCLVFAGTVLGKYIIDKTLDDKLNLNITGAPQGNTLIAGAVWEDYEWGTMSDGFGYRIKELAGGVDNLEKIVFCGKDELPTDLVTDWDAEGVNVDAAQKGNVKAFYDSANKTVYVASNDNQMIGTNKYAACMFQDMTSLKAVEGLNFVDTSKTDTMDYMFSGCSALAELDISGFNTSKVTSMTYMFAYCSSLTSLDVSGFDTAKVEYMSGMFSDCSALTELDVSGFDTGAATDMAAMFSNCSSLTELDVSGFKTGNVWHFYSMFNGCSSLTKLDVSGFDTSSATNMGYMFAYCAKLTKLNLIGFDTDMVTNMGAMFMSCEGLTRLNLSSFDTQSVTAIDHMFYGCKNLETIYVSEKWDTSHVVDTTVDWDDDGIVDGEYLNTQYVFAGCDVLVGGQGTSYVDMETADPDFYQHSKYAVIDKAQEGGAKGYFTLYEAYTLISGYDFNWMIWDGDSTGESYDFLKDNVIQWPGWDGGDVRIGKIVFGSFNQYKDELGLTSWDDIAPGIALDAEQQGNIRLYIPGYVGDASASEEFNDANPENQIYYVLSKNNSIILANEDCSYMFRNDWYMTEFSPGARTWAYLSEIVGLELIDTGNVTDMSNMFYGCQYIETLNLSNFDTAKVTDMSNMFYYCSGLTSLDVSTFDTRNVTNMSGMFYIYAGYQLTSLDVSHFDTSKVTDMSFMFSGVGPIKELDLSGFSTESSPIISYMFSDCTELTTIYASELWDPDKVQIDYWSGVFYNSANLVGGEGSTHAETAGLDSDTDYLYARLDQKQTSGVKGLFTDKYAAPLVEDVALMAGSDFNQAVTGLLASASATKLQFGTWSQYGEGLAWTDGTDVGAVANTIRAFVKDDTVYVLAGLSSDDKMIADASCATMFQNLSSLTSIDGFGVVDTSGVTDMSYMFSGCSALTSVDTVSLTTSSVTTMQGMFSGSRLSSLDLSSFDTSLVEDMSYMFQGTRFSSLDLSSFDTSLVEDMSYMFNNCTSLTSLTRSASFNTSLVKNMSYMFCSTYFQILDLTDFDTSSVEDMSHMFEKCTRMVTLTLTSFDTSQVKNMSYMFSECGRYSAMSSLDLSSFDTSSVTDMSYMFQYCGYQRLASLDLSKFNTSKVENMRAMFSYCGYRSMTSLDVSSFDTSNVKTMRSMFNRMSALTELKGLEGFDTTNVEVMREMFAGLTKMTSIDVSGFVTSNVNDLGSMFYECIYLTELDLSSFDTSKVLYMGVMFYGCSRLTTIYAGPDWSTESIQGYNERGEYIPGLNGTTFQGCSSLSGPYTKYSSSHEDYTYAKIDEGTSSPGYLTYKEPKAVLTTGPDFNAVITTLFADDTSLNTVTFGTLAELSQTNTDLTALWEASTDFVDVGAQGRIRAVVHGTTVYILSNPQDTTNAVIYANADSSSMFKNLTQLAAIEGLDVVNTSNVTNMSSMFDVGYNSALATLDVSGFDTSKVTDMSYMFYYCSGLSSLDVSGFDTSNVTDMRSMFFYCSGLSSLDVSGFDTSKVTSMNRMFCGCSGITSFDLSNFDMSNVTDMAYMFASCKSLTELTLLNRNASNVTTMENMFSSCEQLTTLNLSGWSTSKLTNMSSMFVNCYALAELDLSGWDMSNVTNMSYMFQFCRSLTTPDFSDWNTSSVTNMNAMFQWCSGLTEPILDWNTSSVTSMNAMFYECTGLTTLDLSSWDTNNVTIMLQMFYNCSALKTIYVTELWSTTNLEDGYYGATNMFYGCNSLVGGEGTVFDSSVVDKTYACIDRAVTEGTKGYLTDANAALLTTGVNFNTAINTMFSSAVTKLQFGTYDAVAASDTTLAELWNASTNYVDAANAGTIRVFTSGDTVYVLSRGSSEIYANPASNSMFSGYYYKANSLRNYLKEINGLTAVNTSKVTNMSYMFYACWYLTELDLSSFDTSSVTNMEGMFSGCGVTSLDLSSWDTSSVTDMSEMLACDALASLDLSGWDTSSVTDMSYMFWYCSALTSLDLSSFDTSSVENMSGMFSESPYLTEIKLSSWDTGSVTNMSEMFYNC